MTTNIDRPVQTQYEDYLRHVQANGVFKADRTGTGTTSVFGYQMRFNLNNGFPLVTTKKIFIKGLIIELLWFLRGDTNVKWLQENGVTIWDEWADANGDLGPVYGAQWRRWPKMDGGHIDQVAEVVKLLKTNPDSRRIIMSAWNVADLAAMHLQPCHAFWQWYVADGKLSCQMTQRSVDSLQGLPWNLGEAALLTMMLAQQCDLGLGDLVWSGGDCHIYSNHTEQVALQLTREPYPFPTMKFKRKPDSMFDYKLEDFELVDYKAHPSIKAPIAV